MNSIFNVFSYSVLMCIACCAFGEDSPSPDRPFNFAQEIWFAPGTPGVPDEEFFSAPPGATSYVKVAEGRKDAGDHFVQRVRGWITAPETGSYRFAISSDDASELWISTDGDPSRIRKVASVEQYVSSPRNFTQYSSQLSKPITMIKGTTYYLEARHRDGTGEDHLSIGWKVPRSSFDELCVIGTSPVPAYTLEIFRGADDRDPASHPIFTQKPDQVLRRTQMSTPTDLGTQVATRLTGEITVPKTGKYIFSITADDRAVLFVSKKNQPSSRREIARLDSWTEPESWRGREGQNSLPMPLNRGEVLEIEALHVQGGGPGHLKVGIREVSGMVQEPITSNLSNGGS